MMAVNDLRSSCETALPSARRLQDHLTSKPRIQQNLSASTIRSESGGRVKQWTCQAQRRQRDENYVEFDDDYGFRDDSFSLDFLPATSGRVLRALQTLTDRFVDVVYDLFPVGTSRSVVETITKGGALLVTLAFASSILTFLLNAGFIVLGLYVAAKVFNVDIGGSNRGSERDGYRQKSASEEPPRRSRPSKGARNDAGQAVSDLSDVWFERKRRK